MPTSNEHEHDPRLPISSNLATAAQSLIALLHPLQPLTVAISAPDEEALDCNSIPQILSAIRELLLHLQPARPLYAGFHDGHVHDPLGAAAYAFQDDVILPILQALSHDETGLSGSSSTRTDAKPEISREHVRLSRPIVLHAGAQPNNSPHAGTLVVFCYTFALARAIRERLQAQANEGKYSPPSISVNISLVDTAPVNDRGIEVNGVKHQKSYRNVPGALGTHMADYEQVLRQLSCWSKVPFTTTFQLDFFSDPAVPSVLRYIVRHRHELGTQLSPRYGTLAIRAACPQPGCGLTEKHGRLNTYNVEDDDREMEELKRNSNTTITFHCPHHGAHTITTSEPSDVALLEANTPVRNLIRSISHLLDTTIHHLRVTGSDYAGMYQEVFLYRPLAAWSARTSLAAGRTPHILYAPLITDWSGAKLSRSLYIRQGGYELMRFFGTGGLCSYTKLKNCLEDGKGHVGHGDVEGLRRIWHEVERWVSEPKKLFRAFSVDYLKKVIIDGHSWGD